MPIPAQAGFLPGSPSSDPCPVIPGMSELDSVQLKLFQELQPILTLADGGSVGGRGNGDAVLMKDGTLRFADLIRESELSSILSDRDALEELESEFDGECDEDSFELFQPENEVKDALWKAIGRVARSRSPEFAFWLTQSVVRVLSGSLVSNYSFSSEWNQWTNHTRVPRSSLIPVDLYPGLMGTVFLKPVYDRLGSQEKAAAIVRAAIRVGLSYGVPDRFDPRLSRMEEATRRVTTGEDLDSLNSLFLMDEALQLRRELADLSSSFEKLRSSVGQPQGERLESTKSLHEKLSSFRQRFLQGKPGQADVFRLALESQTLEEFKKREDFWPDLKARVAQWYNTLAQSATLQQSLGVRAVEKSSIEKDLLLELSEFTEKFKEQYSRTAGNSISQSEYAQKESLTVKQLLHPRVKPVLCPLIHTLLSFDPSKGLQSADRIKLPAGFREAYELQSERMNQEVQEQWVRSQTR